MVMEVEDGGGGGAESSAAAAESGAAESMSLGQEEVTKKTVVVGAQLDAGGRALLTWALVNVAAAGDRVVAVHVLSAAAAAAPGAAAAAGFDAMLAVYEGFCNLKQIDLQVKVCRGLSVRRTLVHEARLLSATVLVVGAGKKKNSIAPITKHCAKKLSSTCSVIAVSNGKVVLQTDDAGVSSRGSHSGKVSADLADDEGGSPTYCALPFHRRPDDNPAPSAKPDHTSSDVQDESPDSTSEIQPPAEKAGSPGTESLAEGDSVIYCILPNAGRSSQSFDVSKRSIAVTGISEGSSRSSFSSEASTPATSRPKKAGRAMCKHASYLPISDAAGDHDRCQLPRGYFNHHKRSSSLDWARSSVAHLVRKLPLRHALTSMHLDSLSTMSEVGRDSDGESTSMARTESSSSFSFYDEPWPPAELIALHEQYSSVCRTFAYDELRLATSNFSSNNLVGKGGTSKVYKADLSDSNGNVLAVKVLRPSEAAMKGFFSEVEVVTSLRHKNVIALRGFCIENQSLILVYDYLPNGSLEDILHGNNSNRARPRWESRYRIAVGVAAALEYLHRGDSSKGVVIHGDIKSSNILLSEDFEPLLCDFGLAMAVSSLTTPIMCNDIAGTFGYLAPEYFMYGEVDEKIDVYAFGVVLLEIISGTKPIRTGPNGKQSLVTWATPLLLGGETSGLVDPCFGDDYDVDQMEWMILAATLCTRKSHRSRPHMSFVMKLLQGADDTVELAKSQVSSLKAAGGVDESIARDANLESHRMLALLGVDEEPDVPAVAEAEQNSGPASPSTSGGISSDRWSRSSSFD